MVLMLLNAIAGWSWIPNPNQQWGVRRNYASRAHLLRHVDTYYRDSVTTGDGAASAAYYDGLCSQVRTCMEPRSEVCQCQVSGQLLFFFVKCNCANILEGIIGLNRICIHTYLVLDKKKYKCCHSREYVFFFIHHPKLRYEPKLFSRPLH